MYQHHYWSFAFGQMPPAGAAVWPERLCAVNSDKLFTAERFSHNRSGKYQQERAGGTTGTYGGQFNSKPRVEYVI